MKASSDLITDHTGAGIPIWKPKAVVSLSLLRDLHPLHSHQFAWRTRISPPTGLDPTWTIIGTGIALAGVILAATWHMGARVDSLSDRVDSLSERWPASKDR